MGILSDMLNSGIKAYGIQQERDIARQNLAMQQSNLAYQKELQNTIFAREDNAIQRRARDLEAAGLSKTLAAGNAASAGQVVGTQAPHMDSSFARSYQDLRVNLDLVGSLSDMIQKVNAAKQSGYETTILGNDAKISARDYGILEGLSGQVLSKYAGDPIHQIYSAIIDFFSPRDKGNGDGSTDSLAEEVLQTVDDFIGNSMRQSFRIPFQASWQESFPIEIDPLGALDEAVGEVTQKVKKILGVGHGYAAGGSSGGNNYKAVYVK